MVDEFHDNLIFSRGKFFPVLTPKNSEIKENTE